MKHLLIFLSLVLVSFGTFAQKQDIDGVKDIDPEVLAYYKKCEQNKKLPIIIPMTDTLMKMADRTNDHRTHCAALCERAFYYYRHDIQDSAELLTNEVKRYARKYNSPKHYYWIWNMQIDYLSLKHYYQSALEQLQLMYEEAKAENSAEGLVQSYFSLSKTYERLGNYKQAYSYDSLLVAFSIQNVPETYNLDAYFRHSVDMLCKLKRYDEIPAIIKLGRSYCKRESQGYAMDCAEANYYLAINQPRSAEPFVRNIEYAFGSRPTTFQYTKTLIEYHMAVGNYQEALDIIDNYYNVSKLTTYDFGPQYYSCLLQIPSRHDEGIAFAEKYFAYRDSISQEIQQARFDEFSAKFQLDLIKRQGLEANNRLINKMFAAAVILLAVMTTMVIFLFTTRRRLRKTLNAYDTVSDSFQQVETDIRGAQLLQYDMLKTEYPAFPDRKDIDVYANMLPAKEVSGDLYDYFIYNDKLYFIQGDVSGKGVTSSLFMAITLSSFRSFAKGLNTSNEIVSMLNRAVIDNNDLMMFVTVAVGILDLKTNQLDFCNAGHNLPVLAIKEGGLTNIRKLDIEPGLAIGLDPDFEYKNVTITFTPGSKLLLYTDGLCEAENEKQQQYGETSIVQAFAFHAAKAPKEVSEHIMNNVSEFVQNTEQKDDLTILIIENKGSIES